jgi:hypothetical protein
LTARFNLFSVINMTIDLRIDPSFSFAFEGLEARRELEPDLFEIRGAYGGPVCRYNKFNVELTAGRCIVVHQRLLLGAIFPLKWPRIQVIVTISSSS